MHTLLPTLLLLALLLPSLAAPTIRQAPACPDLCLRSRRAARRTCTRALRPFCILSRCPFSPTREGFVCRARNVLPSSTPSPSAPPSPSASPLPSESSSASLGPSESSTPSPVPSQSSSTSPAPSESSTPSPAPSESSSTSPAPSESSTPSPAPSESSSASPIPSESSTPSPVPSESSSTSPMPSESATSSPSTVPSASPTPSTSPPPPRYVGAVICASGRSVFNVGVVDIDGELNIPIFSVTEDTALEYLDCIQNDRSTRSVEEYLGYAYNNCIGEDPGTCVVNDLATGNCTCTRGNSPIRCIFPPYRRSVRRCDDV